MTIFKSEGFRKKLHVIIYEADTPAGNFVGASDSLVLALKKAEKRSQYFILVLATIVEICLELE